MRILALTRYQRQGASSRMRICQYAAPLRERGLDVTIMPLMGENYLARLNAREPTRWREVAIDYLKRVNILFSAKRFDLLWIEKELFPWLPAWAEAILAGFGHRYVVDYDDAVFHNYDRNRHYLVRKLLGSKLDRVMRGASAVVCGNSYLAERARSAGARHVEIIPTVVDVARYPVRPKAGSGAHTTIGWIGSFSTARYLDIIAPALRIVAATTPLRLVVIGAHRELPGLDVEYRAWSEDTEVDEIRRFDIGVMPLDDGPWERGKCGYKLIQYMACCLPVVASPVGINCEIVQHGANGFLAADVNAWADALRTLCASPDLRVSLGARGRRAVEQHYSLEATTPRLEHLFRTVAADGYHSSSRSAIPSESPYQERR